MVCFPVQDLKIVSAQLGREPKNVLKVAKRCSFGFPVVVESSPMLNGKPFPTIYWLTCPFLIKAISVLESDGGIPRYEEILSGSSELYGEHVDSHLRARKKAMELAGSAPAGVLKRLETCGMGGIKDLEHVKCLHMHTAYHLGGIENPIGKGVISELACTECDDALCSKYAEVD